MDVVAITEVGVIVFEVKDYSGWIFGNGKQSKWTQVLAYGKEKYRFYNPIMQNSWHINALRKLLKPFNIPFYSVIVFYGDCELKDITFIPEGTLIVTARRVLEAVHHIINKNNPINYTNKTEVIKRLQSAVKNGDSEGVQEEHIENIKDMLGKDRIFK